MSDLTCLTTEERDVWSAVYAATWVACAREHERALGPDAAADFAERAVMLANRAVLQLRAYREERGHVNAGRMLDLEVDPR